mgnify:CR=1 FL=1
MNVPLLIVYIVLLILVSFSIYYITIKKRRHYIASLAFIDLGLFFLILTQTVGTNGSWDDLIYALFGFVSFVLSFIITVIVTIVRYFKYRDAASKG